MTVGKKISWSSAGQVVLSIGLGSFSLWSIAHIQRRFDLLAVDSLPGVYQIGKLETAVEDIRATMLMRVASVDQADPAIFERTLGAFEKTARQAMQD